MNLKQEKNRGNNKEKWEAKDSELLLVAEKVVYIFNVLKKIILENTRLWISKS